MKETRKEGRKNEVKPNLSKNKDRRSGRTNKRKTRGSWPRVSEVHKSETMRVWPNDKKLFKLKRQSQQIKRSYCRYNIKCLGFTEIAEFP